MQFEENDHIKLFGNEGTMGLFVALYLILLAFFILLNAVSDQAANRAAEAMESVNSTFKRTDVQNIQKKTKPNAKDIAANDKVLASIQKAFVAELDLPGRFASHGGNTFDVVFPVEYLFEAGSFRIRRNMLPFLDQLIEAIRSGSSPKTGQVAFLFGTGTAPVARDLTRSKEMAVRRAGSLARYFTSQGVDESQFSVGFTHVSERDVLAAFWSAPQENISGG